jgi:hypothetical protein
MGFLVATIWAITAHKYENCGSNRPTPLARALP